MYTATVRHIHKLALKKLEFADFTEAETAAAYGVTSH